MSNVQMSKSDFAKFDELFKGKHITVINRTNRAIHFIDNLDCRSNTIKYVLYVNEEGYYMRRFVRNKTFSYATHPYQMFRNGCDWKHFATIEEAIDAYKDYRVNHPDEQKQHNYCGGWFF
jgi:hypothetical protein